MINEDLISFSWHWFPRSNPRWSHYVEAMQHHTYDIEQKPFTGVHL